MTSATRHLTRCVVILACLTAALTHAERPDAPGADTPLSRSKREAKCHPKFQQISGHTACLPGRDVAAVTEAEKQTILDLHNQFRANVSPTASDMIKLRWDDEVAMLAQKWADSCKNGHDENAHRKIPGRLSVGQNVASGHASWSAAITAWHSEVSAFTYNDQTMNTKLMQIGHYTQVVWAKTSLLGCGVQQCKGRNTYVCNYAPPGNFGDSLHVPYKRGSSCDDCSSHCSEGKLCDCQLTCYNRGTLDLSSCTCSCSSPADLYQPPACALNCSGADQTPHCGSGNSQCPRDSVPCPHKCDVCPTAGIGYKEPVSTTPEMTTTRSAGIRVSGHLQGMLTLLMLQLARHLFP